MYRNGICRNEGCERKARYSDGLCGPHHKESPEKVHGNCGRGIKDITGKKFGMLTVVERLPNSKDKRTRWKCICDCGNETIARGESLKNAHTRSCGCLHRKSHGEASKRGRRETAEYRVWAGMIRRCSSKNDPKWHDYGGRGITVFDGWRHNYPAFLSYIGRRPSDSHSLDRIDVNGNYEPGNVRWATAKQQMANRRPVPRKAWRQAAKHAYRVVDAFEHVLSSYTGAPYVVAVDSCTAALHIVCEYLKVKEVEIPKYTYVGVPNSIIHAKGKVRFRDEEWTGSYQLKPYPIIDSARRFTSGMYVPGTFMCLSFHWTKHLPIGRGGAILLDDENAVETLQRMAFDGRKRGSSPKGDKNLILGFHYYMTPNLAAQGLMLMSEMAEHNDDLPNSAYPDLSLMEIFK